MERNLHIDGPLQGPAAGWRTSVAAFLLAGLSLVICVLITEAGLRASAARAALPSALPERTDKPGVRAWLASHSVLYLAVRQRVTEAVDRVANAG